MFAKLKNWYHTFEQEQLNVLLDPSLAEQAPTACRRKMLRQLAKLTPIERSQLHAFSLRYTTSKLSVVCLKIMAVLCTIGLLVHWLAPTSNLSLIEMLVLVNVLGWATLMGLVGIWFNYRRAVRNKFKAAAVLIGSMFIGGLSGAAVAALTTGKPTFDALARATPKMAMVSACLGVAYLLMVLIVAAFRNREYEAIAAGLLAEAERERLARQLSESQLRLLRAQIEPHFLFNTLGAVQQLAEKDAPRAAELTANLIAFLRVSTVDMSAECCTVAAEFELVRAYLEVMQARLGTRLHWQLALPPELGRQTMPSMALLTLVENAIKHGVEPSPQPVSITVAASQHDAMLHLSVHDTGMGLGAQPGNGIGLHNVKERLRLRYGERAGLTLHEDDGGGVVAAIRLPLDHVMEAA